MRRYFSILAVAMATIFLCSCEFSSAEIPDPQRANKLLWRRVSEGLQSEYRHAQVIAHLNDIMLGKAQCNAAYGECEVIHNDSIYTLDYHGSKYGAETYRVLTAGKRLDEGGEWIVYVKYGSYMQLVNIGTVKGSVGENSKFTLTTYNVDWCRYDYSVSQESVIEYSVNDIEEVLTLTMVSATGLNTDYLRDPSSADYTIDYTLLSPLVFKGDELISGKVDIIYRSVLEQTRRTLVVEVANKIVTFAENK